MEAITDISGILVLLGGIGGFIVVCIEFGNWLCRDKRYDKW